MDEQALPVADQPDAAMQVVIQVVTTDLGQLLRMTHVGLPSGLIRSSADLTLAQALHFNKGVAEALTHMANPPAETGN